MDPDIIRGAKNNDISEVRAALHKNWGDIKKQDLIFGLSALHYASSKGNMNMVSFLLEQKGVDIGLKDRWDRDVLDVAILCGNQQIVDELFKFRHQGKFGDDDPDSKTTSPSGVIRPLKPT